MRTVNAAPQGAWAEAARAQAMGIHAEEEAASDAMARHGADLLAGTRRILTHCNTGALAAPGRGTALSVVAELAARGELVEVLATESRPLLQGARLTVYELRACGIPHTLIVDSAAAGLLAAGAAQAVIVGCDRVAANGDVANKVGTYALALAAQAAGVPFVVVGPTSTIDFACPTGAAIAIEERGADEVLAVRGQSLAPRGNPGAQPGLRRHPGRAHHRAGDRARSRQSAGRGLAGRAGWAARLKARYSRIRRESQMAWLSMTSTGTRCCPVRLCTSSRRARRWGIRTCSKAIPCARSARATVPHGHSQSVGTEQRYSVATVHPLRSAGGPV